MNRVDDERYMGWVESAKRPETRARRIAETVRRVIPFLNDSVEQFLFGLPDKAAAS